MSGSDAVYLNTKKHKASPQEDDNKKKKAKKEDDEPYDFKGGMLSSWHELPFVVNGVTYPTIEVN